MQTCYTFGVNGHFSLAWSELFGRIGIPMGPEMWRGDWLVGLGGIQLHAEFAEAQRGENRFVNLTRFSVSWFEVGCDVRVWSIPGGCPQGVVCGQLFELGVYDALVNSVILWQAVVKSSSGMA